MYENMYINHVGYPFPQLHLQAECAPGLKGHRAPQLFVSWLQNKLDITGLMRHGFRKVG